MAVDPNPVMLTSYMSRSLDEFSMPMSWFPALPAIERSSTNTPPEAEMSSPWCWVPPQVLDHNLGDALTIARHVERPRRAQRRPGVHHVGGGDARQINPVVRAIVWRRTVVAAQGAGGRGTASSKLHNPSFATCWVAFTVMITAFAFDSSTPVVRVVTPIKIDVRTIEARFLMFIPPGFPDARRVRESESDTALLRRTARTWLMDRRDHPRR